MSLEKSMIRGDVPPYYVRSESDGIPISASAAGWPNDVDLDVLYQSERAEVDDVVRDALDLSVWSLEHKKGNTNIYLHCKNNEKLSFSVRAVTRVTGTVPNVMECLRSPDSASFRQLTKTMHSKLFLDSEVLHAHAKHNRDAESLALKWMAFSNGKKTIGRGKEFCVREYTTIIRDHPVYGQVGVCKFESYDGVGARYAIRAKHDAYSLTVLEPSAFVVVPTQSEDGLLSVTLTFSMRKARSRNSVSSGVKALSLRLAHDLSHLQHTAQHMLFQPAALADKREWVSDNDRTNCSLCVQSFNMIKRKHHCRVCGEVVCHSCTVFKVVDQVSSSAKVRVCKACLGKSTTMEVAAPVVGAATATAPTALMSAGSMRVVNNQLNTTTNPAFSSSMANFKNITLSVVSNSSGTSSSSSDESRRSGEDGDPVGALPMMMAGSFKQNHLNGYSSSLSSSMYSKASSSSFSDLDVNPAGSSSSSYLSPQNTGSASFSNAPPPHPLQNMGSSRIKLQSSTSMRRTHFFNEDFEEICMLGMQTLNCAMAGIRTDDFELVNYFDGQLQPDLPRSLPTFRRIASRGKPCIVLDVSADKRIAGEKRSAAKLQFFIGIPLIMDGEVIGDLCVADRYPRDSIDHQAVEVLMVLGKTVTQYMTSHSYIDDLAYFKLLQRKGQEQEDGLINTKEVAF